MSSASRVEKEMIGVAGQRDAEVVADAFAQAVSCRCTECQRQVRAQRGYGIGMEESVGETGFLVHGNLQ